MLAKFCVPAVILVPAAIFAPATIFITAASFVLAKIFVTAGSNFCASRKICFFVDNYGHGETVSSPNHTFPGQA